MAKPSKPKLLTSKGKSPLLKGSSSASMLSSSKNKSPLMPGKKRDYAKSKLPEQAFAIPGFGDTALTGES